MRIVVVGTGRMGQTHIKAAQKRGHQVIGVTDSNLALAGEVAREFGSEQNISVINNLKQYISSERPDLVVVASTAPSHFNLVMDSLDSGAPAILCEKPIACSIAEAQEMDEFAASRGALLAVNHQRRFMGQYRLIKKYILENELGKFQSLSVSASNFGLAMNGTHYFEAFNWLASSPIATVNGWLDEAPLTNPRGHEFIDFSGQVFGKNKEGQRLFMDIGNDLGNGISLTYGFQFGKIVVNEIEGSVSIWTREPEHMSAPTSEYALPSRGYSVSPPKHDLIDATCEVLDAIQWRRSFPSVTDGILALRAVIAAIVSSSGGSVPIELDDPQLVNLRYSWA